MRASLKENLIEKRVNELNFKETYEQKYPPEAMELKTLVDSFNKDTSKDQEIEKYKKNAEDKFKKIKNLVPDTNKFQISSLRMEEFEDGNAQDRRNKSIIRSMNAGKQVNNQKNNDDDL